MRIFLIVLGLIAGPALGHPGHIGELAGHGHLGGVILVGLAAAIGLWAALKGKKSEEVQDDGGRQDDADEELQEA